MNPNDRHQEPITSYLDATGEHPISRTYRAAGDAQLPAHRDAAILAAAREAAHSSRRRSRGPFTRHWTLSAAALKSLPRRKAETRAEGTRAGTAGAPAIEGYSDTAAKERDDVTDDPAAWLRRIRTLAAAGHTAEARAQLQQLQRQYLDYPFPALPQPEKPTTR